MFKGINVVSITVPDIARARAFYADVLGLGAPVYNLPDMGWTEFQTGGAGNISLTTPDGEFAPSRHTTIVLNVDDCATAVAALRARGARCDDPVGIPGMVTYASIYDPFGNRLQICSAPPAQ